MNEDLVQQFISYTSCNRDEAENFLNAAKGDLQTAINKYYESSTTATSKSQGSSKGKNVATLSDISAPPVDKSEQPQSYFVGGGKASGQLVEDASKKKGKSSNLIEDILKKAAEGAKELSNEPQKETKEKNFGGSGYRLGNETDVSKDAGPSKQKVPPKEELEPVTRQLTFWKNGFTIEDGDLLLYDDPKNDEFLKAISSGKAPISMLNVKPGQHVDLKVAHKMEEVYVPQPKKIKPFSGTGQRLGSITSSKPSVTLPGSFVEVKKVATFEVDQSKPITSIQIRLGDGSRIVGKFNHSHTVGDIRNFINSSRPDESLKSYLLQTTIPVRPLVDDSRTVAEESLLNSVVVQKYS